MTRDEALELAFEALEATVTQVTIEETEAAMVLQDRAYLAVCEALGREPKTVEV